MRFEVVGVANVIAPCRNGPDSSREESGLHGFVFCYHPEIRRWLVPDFDFAQVD